MTTHNARLTTDKGHPLITIAHHEPMAQVSLKAITSCIIQLFEDDLLWKVSLKLVTVGIILKKFTNVSFLLWTYDLRCQKNFKLILTL